MSIRRLREVTSSEALLKIDLLVAKEQTPKRKRKPLMRHPVGSPFAKLKRLGYPTSYLTRWGKRR